MPMRVTVFGAGGRTGRGIVRIARARGREVTAFVRRETDLDADRIVTDDARDADAVRDALEGADAAISVLSLVSADAEPEHSEATATIVRVASETRVHRLVVTANNDILTDREVTGEFAAHAREHRRNHATVEASDLDWTILAAPWVTDDEPRGAYDAVIDAKAPGRRIGSVDLALACVDALERDAWIRRVVGVSAS